MQCECCRSSPDCEHRRNEKRLVGDPLAAAARTFAPDERQVSEATRQEEIRQALIAAGWRTWRIGQRNARGTQDAGVPDLYALHPQHGALWVEAKRPNGGMLSRSQLEFREACIEAGVPYVRASQVTDLADWLIPNHTEAAYPL